MDRVPSHIPPSPSLAFIAEAPGDGEVNAAQRALALGRKAPGPLVGTTGLRVHSPLCEQLGIDRVEQMHANVIGFKLEGNDMRSICVTRDEQAAQIATDYALIEADIPCHLRGLVRRVATVNTGAGYLAVQYWPELARLYQEIERAQPKVLVALGKTAVWALYGGNNFKQRLGHVTPTLLTREGGTAYAGVVSYHPSYALPGRAPGAKETILRCYERAWQECGGEARPYVAPSVHIAQTVADVQEALNATKGKLCAWDIETSFDASFRDRQSGRPVWWRKFKDDVVGEWHLRNERRYDYVSMIQWAASVDRAYVVRFVVGGRVCWSFDDMVEVYRLLRQRLADPNEPKVFQRGQFDVTRLYSDLRIAVAGWCADTLIQSHAINLGEPKDLSTIAARHLRVPDWWVASKGKGDDM